MAKKPTPVSAQPVAIPKPRLQLNLLHNRLLEPNPKKREKTQRKLQKLRTRRKWANVRFALISFAIFAVIFNYQVIAAQFQVLWASREVAQTPTQPLPPTTPTTPAAPVEAEAVSAENVIIIPKINVRAPLVFPTSVAEADVLKALEDGVVHYAGTANPGEVGNSVFFGHSSNDAWVPGNYKFVFVLLEKLTDGDTFEIHYNQRKYVYRVTATKVVEPTDLSVLRQGNDKTATLITCTPPGTSWRRFVVTGNQIEPSQQPAPQPEAAPAETQPPTPTQAVLPSNAPSLWEQVLQFFSSLFGRS